MMFCGTRFNKFISAIALCAIAVAFCCNQPLKNEAHKDVSNASIEKGRMLADKYCQSCHQFPDPSLLDANTWEHGVLPAMGPRLGIFSYGFARYPSYKTDKDLDKNFYPSKPVVNAVEWQNIIDYYTSLSPDTLPEQQRPEAIKAGLRLFTVEVPKIHHPGAAISFAKIDTSGQTNSLMFFDLSAQQTLIFNNNLQLTDSFTSNSTLVDVDFNSNAMLACNIGMINPNNGRYGLGQRLFKQPNGKLQLDANAVLRNLARPVQIISGDLNSDRRLDYLVCEFGHLTGALSWMENKGNNQYVRHVVRESPGALKAYIEDYNHDGLMDIWALFSQGEEGIYLFTNKGKRQFDQKQVLRFPSVYGSTYFEFADFDKDGYQDIVYTCGDNADFSLVLKPYHGVYIFLNDGKNNFKQKYFFPINGCYKAMARDFDRDGDIDIATIAFFADYEHQPEEGFVYLENKGDFKFEPFTIAECTTGRWLTMDAGDLDGDGREDIVLGNFSIRPSVTKPTVDWKKGPPFLVLKNVGK
jgi:hypothetical protein